MKKTWIKIKRGLLEPKHREKLGAAWFLYFYMLDKTNWDNGIIQEWTDESAAQELDMPLSTLRYQRRQLEDALYIQTFQKQRYLQIKINNWTNPREYSGEVYNRKGDKKLTPSEFQGYNQGDNKGAKELTLLHIDSHITESQLKEKDEEKIKISEIPEKANELMGLFIARTFYKPEKITDEDWLAMIEFSEKPFADKAHLYSAIGAGGHTPVEAVKILKKMPKWNKEEK